METEVVADTAGFRALKTKWDDLLTRVQLPTPFLTHEWLCTWWEHFGKPGALRLVCVYDGDRLLGVAPFMASTLRVRGIPCFSLLSALGGVEADYHDLLLDHERRWDVLHELLSYCVSELGNWQIVALGGVRGDSATNYLLPVVCSRLGLKLHSVGGLICPYVPLVGDGSDSWAAYRRRGAIQEYRRKQRILGREHGAQVRLCRGDDAARAFADFIRLHHASWSARGGSKAIRTPSMEGFHREVATNLAAAGKLLVATLEVEDAAIAAWYCYLEGSTCFGYLPGWDPAYYRLSPGAVLHVAVIDHCQEAGYQEVDLLRGDESYKFHFTKLARATIQHGIARSPRIARFHRLIEALSR